MGLALAILVQASALDALDAWEARLREAGRFAVTATWEGVEGPQEATFLFDGGRFRVEWALPGGRRRVAVCDGRRVAYAPWGGSFLPSDDAPGLLRGFVYAGARLCFSWREWDLGELSVEPAGERGYAIRWGDLLLGGEVRARDDGLVVDRWWNLDGGGWTERYAWDLSPEVPADAFDLPWDFGLPAQLESSPWVPEPRRISLDLDDATLLRAAGDVAAAAGVPVEVSPVVAGRRGSVALRDCTAAEAVYEIARAWGVGVWTGLQWPRAVVEPLAARFPPEGGLLSDVARGSAGPFLLRVTSVERGPEDDLRLQLQVLAPGARWLKLILFARDLEPVGFLMNYAYVAREAPAGARSLRLEGVLTAFVPEDEWTVELAPPFDGRVAEAGPVRIIAHDEPPGGIGAVFLDVSAAWADWEWTVAPVFPEPGSAWWAGDAAWGAGPAESAGHLYVHREELNPGSLNLIRSADRAWRTPPIRLLVVDRLRRVDFPFEIDGIPIP